MKLTFIFISPFFGFVLLSTFVYFQMLFFVKWTLVALIFLAFVYPIVVLSVGRMQDQD